MPRVPHSGMEIIRRLATEANVGYSLRAFERSDERDIDLLDALAVLRQGEIEGEIVAGNSLGEWKCKVTGKAPGASRSIGVVVVVVRERRLFIVTIEWEDE